MYSFFNWARLHYKTGLLATFCFLGFMVFEAAQQLFYSLNFNNGNTPDVTFSEVFFSGFTRWIIFLVLAIPLVRYSWNNPLKNLKLSALGKLMLLVFGLLFLNLSAITLKNVWLYGDVVTDFSEVFEFYFFHKAPIILVALVFVVILTHYFKKQEELALSISEMGSLKYSNQQLYEQLKSEAIEDEAMVIQVKVGNRVKLVPLETIVWVEADDYCVRIHDDKGKTYTLRSTMKALEQKLPGQSFLRVHRKALVNLGEIKEYAFGSKATVVLKDGTEIPLAQSRIKDVRNVLQGAV